MEILEQLSRSRARIEAHLDTALPAADAHPPAIHRAIRYAALGEGKRLRPILALMTTEMVGMDAERILDAAAAIELVHASTLVLDDLPCMDDATLRRGRPATHVEHGQAFAILAAVAMLVHAFDLVAANALALRVDRRRAAELMHEMAVCTGSVGLIGGQVRDLETVHQATDLATLEYIHSHKTGQLFMLAATIGPMLGEVGGAELEAIREYAKNLGLAYQIVDDLLDRSETSAVVGKNVGQDRSRTTFATLVGEEAARALVAELTASANHSLAGFGRRADSLRALADLLSSRLR